MLVAALLALVVSAIGCATEKVWLARTGQALGGIVVFCILAKFIV